MGISGNDLASGLMLLPVLAGAAWGVAAARGSHSLVELCGLAAFVSLPLLFIAWFHAVLGGPAKAKQSAWVGGLICYSILFVLADPFLWMRGPLDISLKLLLLVPLLVGLRFLIRLRSWLAASGVALLLAASVALACRNCLSYKSGHGFSGSWNA